MQDDESLPISLPPFAHPLAASSAWVGLGRLALAAATAALLVLSFPNFDQGWLAWIALAPLAIACHGLGPLASFRLGIVSGMGAAFGTYWWMFQVPGFKWYHLLIGALYLALYPAAWCAGLPRLARVRLPLTLTAPALWVALDYIRANAGFLALPWATLAQSQHRNLALLQVATFTGEYGITFLVVMGSAAVTEIITRRAWPSAVAAGAVIALAHAGGTLAMPGEGTASTLRVTVIQPSMLLGERKTPAGRAASLDRLERLTRAAAVSGPALIAWPETAVHDLTKDPALLERIQRLARDIEIPLVVGASEFEKFAPRGDEAGPRVRSYNAAYLILPGQPLSPPYHKMLLVPFAEYLPLESIVRWPSWLAPRVFDTIPGEGHRLFTLPDGTPFAALICWENLFASFVRQSVTEGAQLLVQLTNDNWFGPTAAPRQHNLASVLRAVENRVPLVIASNTGPSQIVDPYGRILASIPDLFVEGVAMAEVPLGTGRTIYTRLGDLFALASLVGVALALTYMRRR